MNTLRRRVGQLEQNAPSPDDPESPARIRQALIEIGQPAPDIVPGDKTAAYIARTEAAALRALLERRAAA